jgi:hypothetical protein
MLATAEPRARPKAERFYRPFRDWTRFSLGSRHFVPGYFRSVPPGRPAGSLARRPTRRLQMCFSQHFVLGFYYQCPFWPRHLRILLSLMLTRMRVHGTLLTRQMLAHGIDGTSPSPPNEIFCHHPLSQPRRTHYSHDPKRHCPGLFRF